MVTAVRNIRPGIGSTRPIPVQHFIPPSYSPIYKVELVTDSTTYDITDILEEAIYDDGVTDNIGSFDFKIIDPNQSYSDNVTTFNYIKIYMDYGTTATTLRFKGIVEKVDREDIYFKISGRSMGMISAGKNIIYNATDTSRSDILKAILTANFPTINQDNIITDATTVSVNYTEASFQTIVEKICGNHHDFYIDADLKAHYFVRGSKENTTEAISQDYNYIKTEGYGADSQETITKVRVYGKKEDLLPIYATSSSNTSITNDISKEIVLNDNSILTQEEAADLADSVYISSNSVKNIGAVTSLLLPTIAPGEKIKIAIPLDNISPDYYQINSFSHNLSKQETTLIIQKRKLGISKIIKKNIVSIDIIPEKDNIYDLDFSKAIRFTSDSGTFYNTERRNNFLRVATGTAGTWTSDTFTFDSGISKLFALWAGGNLIGSTISYSLDGGLTYTSFGITGSLVEPPARKKTLIIKITLNTASAYVKGFVFQYSLTT